MTITDELTTPRMRLRPLAASDIDWLVELDADPEVTRYLAFREPNTRERYERELLPRMLAYTDQPYGFYAAVDAHGEVLGWFHLRPSVADEQMLELGYRLRRAAWGSGLATEGSQALLRRAFFELDQREVDACTMPENAASIAVMRKCGMQYVGRFVHPRATWIEVERYLVDRDTFARLHGPGINA